MSGSESARREDAHPLVSSVDEEPFIVPTAKQDANERPTLLLFRQTDAGNAQRLAALYGEDLRYVPEDKRWLRWDGARWTRAHDTDLMRLAKATIAETHRQVKAIPDEHAELRARFIKHTRASESRYHLRNMVELAASEPRITRSAAEFDKDPFLVTCLNGTINLRTGTLRPHAREDNITRMLPVEFDAAASAPTWEAFLRRVMNDDEEMVAYLRRAAGYSLTGDTREQVWFLLHGTGQNGKSTFVETLRTTFGEYATQTQTETLLMKKMGGGIPNDLARLRGARFVAASEVESGRRLNEALLKQLTGGDSILARFLYGEYFDFVPTLKLWMSVNHLPNVKDNSKGMWRRVRRIPFAVTIPDAERDPTLDKKLAAERAGILAWAVRGAVEWGHEGLKTPLAVEWATDQYREHADEVGAFLNERCEDDESAFTPGAALYADYVAWAQRGAAMDRNAFTDAMNERGYTAHRTAGARGWKGVRLLE